MLAYLLRRAGEVVRRADVMLDVFGYAFDPGTNVLDVHLSHLRRKLAGFPVSIETVRGVGFRLEVRYSFDDFLAAEGLLADAESVAIKRVLAFQVAQLMKDEGISKTEMARRMKTSRSALERLLDPENDSVTLQTLEHAAQALGKRLRIEFAA